MIRLIGTGCMILLLTGCGSTTLAGLKSKPEAKYEFDAPMSAEATYALIASPALNCFESDSWAASWYTEAERNADQHSGRFILSKTSWITRYYALIEVVPKAASTTGAHVTVWTDRADLQHLGPAAEHWANGKAMSGERMADCN